VLVCVRCFAAAPLYIHGTILNGTVGSLFVFHPGVASLSVQIVSRGVQDMRQGAVRGCWWQDCCSSNLCGCCSAVSGCCLSIIVFQHCLIELAARPVLLPCQLPAQGWLR
jgi:hypothetical protein